jgi:hypothetical protein
MYPALDLTGALEYAKQKAEQRPVSILEEYLASSQQKALSRRRNGVRMELAFSMMQNGRLVDASGSNAYLDPLRSLESAGPQPPYILAHGKTDISVINNDPFATRKGINNSSGSLQYS